MGWFGRAKRWVIDRLVGKEKEVLMGLLTRTEARVDEIAARLPAEPASAAQLRRLLAEQKLAGQLALGQGLHLAGPARSVLFLHNSYYHFHYLAQALRRRGWRALTVSLEDPAGPNAGFYHGEDLNLHDPDPLQLQANAEALFRFAKANFELMHFAGDGLMGFLPEHFGSQDPPDILEWKRLGRKLAYTVSGCHSAVAQSSVREWSRHPDGQSMCGNCPWENRPDVCSDDKNLAWGRTVERHCDMVFSGVQPSLDYLAATRPNVVRGTMSTVLDETLWRPGLEIPAAFRVEREPGEVLIYHAFGNYAQRGSGERNVKGTPYVLQAVERLRAEGVPVRLLFATGVPNGLVRYYQAQADIVVDQLWAGMWGANGRESMMLGKPVVAYVNQRVADPTEVLEPIATAPVVQATAATLYEVLKALAADPACREDIGRRSREFALRWYSPDAGAAAYEAAYDAMLARGIRLEVPAATTVNP